MEHHIGAFIARKRREMGYTQRQLAEKLNLSCQAVSKWESGASAPDLSLLSPLAAILHTTVDALVGYHAASATHYEDKYSAQGYYWGLAPNALCYDLMCLKPPVKPYRVLDMGCGEGKDAVFLAKNGYRVSAFDLAESGLDKARRLAEQHHVDVRFFKADINDYQPDEAFDVVFSSGVLHYVRPDRRKPLFDALKACTPAGGLHVLNVFVHKPFLPEAPDLEEAERAVPPWHSGELMGYYADWLLRTSTETIFDCQSAGIPHKHCMDVVIAEKMS